MKKLFLCHFVWVLGVIVPHKIFAQATLGLGFQASYVLPAIPNNYYYKPAPNFELMILSGDIDDHFRVGMQFGYCSLKPTQDTFNTVTVLRDISGRPYSVNPGYNTVSIYDIYSAGFDFEYRPVIDTRFTPMVGLDLYYYYIYYGSNSVVENYSQLEEQIGFQELALAPKIGLTWRISDNWQMNGGIAYNWGFFGGVDNTLSYWKPFINIEFVPDN